MLCLHIYNIMSRVKKKKNPIKDMYFICLVNL